MAQILLKDHDKILEGKYHYIEEGTTYSEENFALFRPYTKEYFVFKSEILTRCSNGEFLKIITQYKVNQEYFPMEVSIHRTMGVRDTIETFIPLIKDQKLKYTFKNKDQKHEEEINMPINRYHIATPSSACSLLFVSSKKYDPTKRNSYSIVVSENVWEVVKQPKQSYVFLETENQTFSGEQEVDINGQKKLAKKYLYFEKMKTEDVRKKVSKENSERPIIFYLSDHFFIPYKIEITDKSSIEIRYLKNMQGHNMENVVSNF